MTAGQVPEPTGTGEHVRSRQVTLLVPKICSGIL